MKRIFVTLALLSNALLLVSFVLGWLIDDAASRDVALQQQVARHFLAALGGLMFAVLVHAIVLTYFMGTGRWMEEAAQAYRLADRWKAESHQLKYRTLPWMAGALVMLILTGAFGAIADPASPAGADGFGGVPASTVHLIIAAATLAFNAIINLIEYQSIVRNGELIQEVLDEVHRIRAEKGLPVS